MSDLDSILQTISAYDSFDLGWKVSDQQIAQYEQQHKISIPEDVRQILKTLGGGGYDAGTRYFNIMGGGNPNNLVAWLDFLEDRGRDFLVFGQTSRGQVLAIRRSDGRIMEIFEQQVSQQWESMADYLDFELDEDRKWREHEPA